LVSEDTFEAWLEDCCEQGVNEKDTVDALFFCWKQWTEASCEKTGTKKHFSQRLKAHGFRAGKFGRGKRGFFGLKIRPATPQAARPAPAGQEPF
jgi:putative DNA primase/helicase